MNGEYIEEAWMESVVMGDYHVTFGNERFLPQLWRARVGGSGVPPGLGMLSFI